MPDILGATNPVPGYEKNTINRNVPLAQENTTTQQIQNSPDLTRVIRADRRTEQQDNGQGKIRYDSNFQTFIERLRESPGTAESLAQIFSAKEGIVVLSGMKDGIALEMAQIMELLKMDEKQLAHFLLGQLRSGTRFNGALFALLRNAYDRASSDGVRQDILQFLKTYSDYSSSGHIENSLLNNLSRMSEAMPASWAEKLDVLIAGLRNSIAAGDRQGSMQLLQRSIFPFVSGYVEQTHDMGLPRELATLLALTAARYENGSEANLLEAFRVLTSYGTLREQLGGFDDQSLLTLLQRSRVDGDPVINRFAQYLGDAATKALEGGAGPEAQEAFRNLISAMLINESVYMPLNHYIIPLQWEERLFFSELWIDPDDEAGGRQDDGQQGDSVKLLFKMDVQSVGMFDIILSSRDKTVDLQIFCPEKAAPFSKQIETAMGEILTRNELKTGRVMVRKMEKPVTLTEVFPKIFEGKNGINVKV